MASNAPQTMQPPQVPSTPVVARQALNELLDYYCQLAEYHRSSIDYHQQLVEQHSSEIRLVEKQLASIKALLDPLTENGAANLTSDRVAKPKELASLADVESESNAEVKPEVDSEAGSKDIFSNGKTTDTETTVDEPEKVSEDLEAAIERQTANNNGESKQDIKEATKAKSQSKATSNAKKSQSKAKKVKSYSSRLPDSPLLERYETIADAVAGCLQEYYPRVMSADEILKHYYPQGLSSETKKRAYGAFSNTLSKGAGNKGWIRESIGKYRWREGI